MQERERYGMTSKSLLIDLIGGDYEAYALQRERLRRLYSDRSGPSKQPLPPTVSLSGRPVVALPNAAASRSKQSDVARGRTNQRNGLENTSGNVSAFPNAFGRPYA